MPRGCRWISVGRYFRDDSCSQQWTMDIARDGSGNYCVRFEGDYPCIEPVGDIVTLVGFFEDYGEGCLSDLRYALENLSGTEGARRMIDIRLRHSDLSLVS